MRVIILNQILFQSDQILVPIYIVLVRHALLVRNNVHDRHLIIKNERLLLSRDLEQVTNITSFNLTNTFILHTSIHLLILPYFSISCLGISVGDNCFDYYRALVIYLLGVFTKDLYQLGPSIFFMSEHPDRIYPIFNCIKVARNELTKLHNH